MLQISWYKSFVLKKIWFTKHRVCFPKAHLSIGKDANIVSIKSTLNKLGNFHKHILFPCLMDKYLVKIKGMLLPWNPTENPYVSFELLRLARVILSHTWVLPRDGLECLESLRIRYSNLHRQFTPFSIHGSWRSTPWFYCEVFCGKGSFKCPEVAFSAISKYWEYYIHDASKVGSKKDTS